MSLIPFCLAPAVIAMLLAKERCASASPAGRRGVCARVSLPVVAMTCCLAWLGVMHMDRKSPFPPPTPYLQGLANAFSKAQIDYSDVVVSADFEAPANPPQIVALTMKRVHLCSTQNELSTLVQDIPGSFQIACFRISGLRLEWRKWKVNRSDRRDEVFPAVVGFMERDAAAPGNAPDGSINFSKDLPEFAVDTAPKLIEAGKSSEAERLCTSAIAVDPELGEAYFFLGVAISDRDPKRAADCYRSAIKYRPKLTGPHFNLGILIANNQPDEAIQQFMTAIQLDPTKAEPYVCLGVMLARSGQMAQAVRCWEDALRLEPDHLEAKKYLVWARGKGG